MTQPDPQPFLHEWVRGQRSAPRGLVQAPRPARRVWLGRTLRTLAAAGVPVSLLTACSTPDVQTYSSLKPELDLRRYFNGTVDAWGMFTDRTGAIVRRFTVDMRCSWQGDEGVLDERFRYDDGRTERRVWKLTHTGDGHFTGTAGDVVGEARGRQSGNAFNWRYTLRLPVGGTPPPPDAPPDTPNSGATVIEVAFDDWMVLMPGDILLNRAVMSKWGVTLGEVTLSFRRREA